MSVNKLGVIQSSDIDLDSETPLTECQVVSYFEDGKQVYDFLSTKSWILGKIGLFHPDVKYGKKYSLVRRKDTPSMAIWYSLEYFLNRHISDTYVSDRGEIIAHTNETKQGFRTLWVKQEYYECLLTDTQDRLIINADVYHKATHIENNTIIKQWYVICVVPRPISENLPEQYYPGHPNVEPREGMGTCELIPARGMADYLEAQHPSADIFSMYLPEEFDKNRTYGGKYYEVRKDGTGPTFFVSGLAQHIPSDFKIIGIWFARTKSDEDKRFHKHRVHHDSLEYYAIGQYTQDGVVYTHVVVRSGAYSEYLLTDSSAIHLSVGGGRDEPLYTDLRIDTECDVS